MNLYNIDFKEFDDKIKVDLILTDIPYNLGVKAYASNPQWWRGGDFRNGASERAKTKFFDTDENFSIDEFLAFCQLHLKEDKSVIVFCSYEQQFEIINKMKEYGFKKYIPLVFIKNNTAETLKSNMRIVGACEYGLQLCNGKLPKFNNNRHQIKNWFNMKRLQNKNHPNEKDVDLLKQFIELFTDPAETVMDCCMGSGSTGVAAKILNRDFIGIELDPKYFEVAKKRIEETE